MSLWTPSGEHPVEHQPQSQAQPQRAPQAAAPPGPPTGEGEPSLDDLTPEQRAEVEEMARQMQEAQARMLQVPGTTVVGRQAAEFYDLAAIYLSQDPPRLEDAHLAVDAFAAVVDKLGSRLGEAEQPLRQALNQLQMAFVEATNVTNAAGSAGTSGAETSGTDAGPGPSGDAG